jgi:hypothetical protein
MSDLSRRAWAVPVAPRRLVEVVQLTADENAWPRMAACGACWPQEDEDSKLSTTPLPAEIVRGGKNGDRCLSARGFAGKNSCPFPTIRRFSRSPFHSESTPTSLLPPP